MLQECIIAQEQQTGSALPRLESKNDGVEIFLACVKQDRIDDLKGVFLGLKIQLYRADSNAAVHRRSTFALFRLKYYVLL